MRRRRFLRGLGDTIVGLPMLEYFLNSNGNALAQGQNLPKFYAVCYNGLSINKDISPETYRPVHTPTNFGSGYDLPPALAAFGEFGVQNNISVVSNLEIPWGSAGVDEPGAADIGHHHTYGHWPLVTGKSTKKKDGKGYYDAKDNQSSDFYVYQQLGLQNKHLILQVEAKKHGSGFADSISINKGRWAPGERDLSRLFASLFQDFSAPGASAEQIKLRIANLAERRSILDLVKDDFLRIQRKLGTQDKQILEQHLAEVRTLEHNISQRAAKLVDQREQRQQTCTSPDAPPTQFESSVNYNGEKQRAEILVDYMHLAAKCGLSQVMSLQLTHSRSGMNPQAFMPSGLAAPGDCHDMTHTEGRYAHFIPLSQWQCRIYASLVKKFKDTAFGDGTLLDHSALLYMIEGGHGTNAETGAANSPHSYENMLAMVAGAVGGLQPGRHIDGKRQHPCKLMCSAQHAVGVASPRVGEVTGLLQEVF